MKKRPDWLKKAKSGMAVSSEVIGGLAKKAANKLEGLDERHQISEVLKESVSNIEGAISDVREKHQLDEKVELLKQVAKEGYQEARDSDAFRDAETKMRQAKADLESSIINPLKSEVDQRNVKGKIEELTSKASSIYGSTRAFIKPYYAPETSRELLVRTKNELLYINSCVLQISRSDSEKLAEKLGRAVTSKLTGAAASAGLLGLVSSFGVAGTGTAISSLSGAAATNATLAWVGGLFGGGMAAGAVVTGGVMTAVAFGVYGLLGSEARGFEDLSDSEKRIVQSTGLLIAAINEVLEDGSKTLSIDEADRLLLNTLRPIFDLLNENAESIISSLDVKNGIAFKQHAIIDFEKNVLDGFQHFISGETASRRLRYPAYAIVGVVYALLNHEEVDGSRESQLVLAALRRSSNVFETASEQELAELLSLYDPEGLKGLVSNVKGIYHEMLFVDDYNSSHSDTYAAMHESTTHPGSDVVIYSADTDQALAEYQFKSTNSESAIREHFEKYPDIEVKATDELASKNIENVESSGYSNQELTGDVEDTMDGISVSSSGGQILESAVESAGLTGLVAAGFEAIQVLNGKKEISDVGREGIKAATVAGTSTVLVAYLFG